MPPSEAPPRPGRPGPASRVPTPAGEARSLAPLALAIAAAVLLASATPAAAAINRAHDADFAFPYDDGFGGGAHTIVSGRLEATLAGQTGTHGWLNTTGARLTGITGACWTATLPACADSPAGGIAITVSDGGAFGIQFPDPAPAKIAADHAMALFVDLDGSETAGGLALGPSIVAVTVGGEERLGPLGTVAFSVNPLDAAAVAVAGDDSTTLTITEDGRTVATLRGTDSAVRFGGPVQAAPFGFESAVAPFGAGDRAQFRPASRDAAATGLDFQRLNDAAARIQGAEPGQGDQPAPPEALVEALRDVLAGAILRIPGTDTAGAPGSGGPADAAAFALVRYRALEVESARPAAAGEAAPLAWTGRATLVVEGDDVAHAKPLVGFGVFQVPWWSLLLWLAAAGVAIANFVLRRPRKDEAWSGYKWLGWGMGAGLGLLTLVLWDLETRAIWGVSVTSAGLSAKARLFILVLEAAPLAIMGLAITSPLRLVLRGALRLLEKPSLGRLTGPLAYPLGFLMGAPYLLSYIEILVRQVLDRLAG